MVDVGTIWAVLALASLSIEDLMGFTGMALAIFLQRSIPRTYTFSFENVEGVGCCAVGEITFFAIIIVSGWALLALLLREIEIIRKITNNAVHTIPVRFVSSAQA